jgi:hypothetical protein
MMKKTNKHHITPRSKGGSSKPHNIVHVDPRKHEVYHQLFSNLTPLEINQLLNELFPPGIVNVITSHLSVHWWNASEEGELASGPYC